MPLLRLASVDGRQTIEIRDRGVVGRQPGVEGLVEDSSVSRQHATLEFGPRGWQVIDHNSANGTWIDGRRVASAELHGGCELRLGLVAFQVEIAAPAVTLAPPPWVPLVPTQPARPSLRPRSVPAPSGTLDFNRLSPAVRKRLATASLAAPSRSPSRRTRSPALPSRSWPCRCPARSWSLCSRSTSASRARLGWAGAGSWDCCPSSSSAAARCWRPLTDCSVTGRCPSPRADSCSRSTWSRRASAWCGFRFPRPKGSPRSTSRARDATVTRS